MPDLHEFGWQWWGQRHLTPIEMHQQSNLPIRTSDDVSNPALSADAAIVRDSFDPLVPIFVLVDPMLGDPLPCDDSQQDTNQQSRREALWQRKVESIALHPRTPLSLHQHPYLVSLHGRDDPLLEITLKLAHAERAEALAGGLDGDGGGAHRIGGWLQSCLSSAQLAAVLSAMFRVNTTAPTKATYLRLADRRVLALLREVAGDVRVAGQFGRLQRWIYLDVHGRLSMLQSDNEEAPPLCLNENEWSCMEQGEALNRTLAQWLSEAMLADDQTVLRQPPHVLYTAARHALTAALSASRTWPHRFSRLTDHATWASLHLLHPELSSSQAVRNLMQRPGTSEEPPEPVRYLHREIRSRLLEEQHGA
jgi:hypothetical protein